MKKVIAIILSLIFISSFGVTALADMKYTPSCDVYSEAVYLADENGSVLYEKNSKQRMYPLELTQIMTAIVVIENIDSAGGWDAQGTYDMSVQNYLYDNRNGGVILSGMLSGDIFTADELFYDLVIRSGYDAALVLAKLIAGSTDAFVDLMNQTAARIGAKDTNFTNCHGLHDTANYTTAYDMYLITKYAMGLDKYREVVQKTSYTCEATDTHKQLIWSSENGLMKRDSVHYYSPVVGGKIGYNSEILGAPYELDNGYNQALVDAKNLYMWAFTEFEVKTIVEGGSQIAEVPLELAWQKNHLNLMIGETYRALLPTDIAVSSISYEFDVPESVEAPITKGEEIGTLKLVLAGETIGTVPLVAAEDVEQSDLLSGLKSFSNMTHSFWFKFIIITIIILIGLYIALMVIRNYNHRKYGNFKRKKRL